MIGKRLLKQILVISMTSHLMMKKREAKSFLNVYEVRGEPYALCEIDSRKSLVMGD